METCGSESLCSRSSQSMVYLSPSYARGLSATKRPLLIMELKKILEDVKNNELDIDSAIEILKDMPYEDL